MSRVFADTNIFGCTVDTKVVHTADVKAGTIKSRGKPDRATTLVVHSYAPRPPRGKPSEEMNLLPKVASLAKDGAFELCYSHEVDLELLFQPLVDVPPGRFYGAPCTLVPSAVDYREDLPRFPGEVEGHGYVLNTPSQVLLSYQRALAAKPDDSLDIVRDFFLRLPDRGFGLHLDFRTFARVTAQSESLNAGKLLFPSLSVLDDERYLEILGLLKTNGSSGPCPNTYVDAYLLWTAELAGCTHFLTLDRQLLDRCTDGPVAVVKPSQLLTRFTGRPADTRES